jgi:hypothetical protein
MGTSAMSEGFPAESPHDSRKMGEVLVGIEVRPACYWVSAEGENDDRDGLLHVGRRDGRHR